jgi:glycosyltransferase involved in cell wall biosynthesis
MSRSRIVIDARPLSHPQAGGFRTYVRGLVQGLGEVAPGDEIILYLDRPLPKEKLPPGDFQVRVLDTNRWRTDFSVFARQVRRDSPDIVHGTMNYLPPHGTDAAVTVTIHDALEIKRYPFVPLPKKPRARLIRWYSARLTRRSAQKACRIVTISGASLAELRAALKLPEDRFKVIYNAPLLPPPGADIPRENNVVLGLASPDPRKNMELLFQAVAEHTSVFPTPPELRIVCNHASAVAHVEASVGRFRIRNVRILQRLNDQALSDCYAAASAFVFPSRMEGFTMPPLEAMAIGCPVASSTAPPMPEILGDVPCWFDPDRPDQLAAALAPFMNDPEARGEVGRKGRALAAQFTCRRMGTEMVEMWRSLA